MSHNFYLHVSSTDSLNRFPANTGFDFTVELTETISGRYMIALCELFTLHEFSEQLFVFCDVVEPYQVHNELSPLLRSVHKSGEVQNLQFMRLSRSIVQRIRITVRDKNNNSPATDLGEVSCTLKFIAY